MSAPNFFTGFLALGIGSTAFVELSGTGYARIATTFGPVVGGVTFCTTAATFAAGANWPTVTQVGLYGPSGNLDMWWNEPVPFTLAGGQTWTFARGGRLLTIPSLMSQSPATIIAWAALSPIGTVNGAGVLMTGPYGGQFGGSL